MPPPKSTLAMALLVTAWVLVISPATARPRHKHEAQIEEATPEPTPHHKPFQLYHLHHHHRHYHHYREPSKHCKCDPEREVPEVLQTHDGLWQRVALLLLSLVGAVLGSCAAVGLWRRFCARRPLHRPVGGTNAPLLQPPPLPLAQDKEAPPPYKETWT